MLMNLDGKHAGNDEDLYAIIRVNVIFVNEWKFSNWSTQRFEFRTKEYHQIVS